MKEELKLLIKKWKVEAEEAKQSSQKFDKLGHPALSSALAQRAFTTRSLALELERLISGD